MSEAILKEIEKQWNQLLLVGQNMEEEEPYKSLLIGACKNASIQWNNAGDDLQQKLRIIGHLNDSRNLLKSTKYYRKNNPGYYVPEESLKQRCRQSISLLFLSLNPNVAQETMDMFNHDIEITIFCAPDEKRFVTSIEEMEKRITELNLTRTIN